jgi:hypothetical protein
MFSVARHHLNFIRMWNFLPTVCSIVFSGSQLLSGSDIQRSVDSLSSIIRSRCMSWTLCCFYTHSYSGTRDVLSHHRPLWEWWVDSGGQTVLLNPYAVSCFSLFLKKCNFKVKLEKMKQKCIFIAQWMRLNDAIGGDYFLMSTRVKCYTIQQFKFSGILQQYSYSGHSRLLAAVSPFFSHFMQAPIYWNMLVVGYQEWIKVNPIILLKLLGCSQISVASIIKQSMFPEG